jgi:thiol-disulfide isomerase/thioredoxin
MHKSIVFMLRAGAMLMFLNCFSSALMAESESLPQLVLTVPADEDHRVYLGLQESGDGATFEVAKIEADILLIELFSMYCPYCQAEAPLVNELYELMQALPASEPMVKIIGIGASNSDFEVDHFRKTYDVEFPLFSDQDMAMYNALAGAGTPGFVGARRDAAGGFSIVLRQSGGFYSAADFLKELIAAGAD